MTTDMISATKQRADDHGQQFVRVMDGPASMPLQCQRSGCRRQKIFAMPHSTTGIPDPGTAARDSDYGQVEAGHAPGLVRGDLGGGLWSARAGVAGTESNQHVHDGTIAIDPAASCRDRR